MHINQHVQQQIRRHRMPVFVTSVIIMAAALVSISMQLYYASDAFRLDLSRPEYTSLRPQIAKDSKQDSAFEAQGKVDVAALTQFLEQYTRESKKITDAQPFAADVLSDEQLGIGE